MTNTKCLSSTELQTLVNKNGIDKATLMCVGILTKNKFNDGYAVYGSE